MSGARFDQSISVVLPAYDEEACIRRAVEDALRFLPTCYADHEVIVVDDGSKDGTRAILDELAAAHPTLVVRNHPRNLGYGRAIATGFRTARMDLVFFTDADSQFDIREMRDVTRHMLDTGADAVFGFRVYRYDSVLRCILSWSYNRLVRVLFRVDVRDVDCSFKLFKREVVETLRIDSNDFFVDTELVARTRQMGYVAVEKGVRHYPRIAGRTSVRPSHVPRTLWTVARMWFRIHFGERAVRPSAAAESEPSARSVR